MPHVTEGLALESWRLGGFWSRQVLKGQKEYQSYQDRMMYYILILNWLLYTCNNTLIAHAYVRAWSQPRPQSSPGK